MYRLILLFILVGLKVFITITVLMVSLDDIYPFKDRNACEYIYSYVFHTIFFFKSEGNDFHDFVFVF